MKFALTLLCEHPHRKTGLTSLFVELVGRSLKLFPELEWIVYAAPKHDWAIEESRVIVVRDYSGSDQMKGRLLADHLKVGPDAAKRGADCLITVGFVPMKSGGLPVAMHMLSLQHLNKDNEVGFLRSVYRKWAASSGLRKADLVITNTQFAISQILEVNPEVKPKIMQSYEGLQHDFYVPEEEEGEVQKLLEKFEIEPGYLYWCSNFYPYKQAEKFFDSYAKLSDAEKEALPIVMVGGGGWGDGLERAMAHAEEVGIKEHVKRLGWVDDEDLAMLYRQARIFCLASREETFGRCVIEAMACGTPCVVNDIPVMHEVTDGFAWIVDFNHPDQGAEAFSTLLSDQERYAELKNSGIKRSKDFDFDLLTKERVNAIRRLF